MNAEISGNVVEIACTSDQYIYQSLSCSICFNWHCCARRLFRLGSGLWAAPARYATISKTLCFAETSF